MRWTIGTKLGMGFGLALLALAILGYVSYSSTVDLAKSNDEESNTARILIELDDVPGRLTEAEAGLSGYLLTGQKEYKEVYQTARDSVRKELDDLMAATKHNAKHQQRLKEVGALVNTRLADLEDAITADKVAEKASMPAGTAIFAAGKSKEAIKQIHKLLQEIDEEETPALAKREKDGDDLAARTENILIVGTLVTLIVLVAFSIVLTLTITNSTNRLLVSATKIAAGNLRQSELPVTTSDEIGELTVAFNKMLASIKDMTGQTRTATQNITSATAEILASTQEQAASTAEQAAAVQQTTATVEEINQSGNQVSERAKAVAASAEAASATSNSGIQAVQNANRTMDAIREQAEAVAENIVTLSEKTQTVGEIVATVNDIAEQSNLLALNAAIEAAAAGEHGRRFSVVAAELKNLADQSKAATVQVRTILGDIQKGINTSVMLTEETVKRVELGKQQSDVAERTIRQMAETTVNSVQAFQQIVAATNQQQIGFEQVTQALKNIRVASQQTAAGTQQMEKASANLNALGQQLNKSVERYEL